MVTTSVFRRKTEWERERERSVLFNDAVNCWDYMALVVDKWNIWSTAGMILTQENWNSQRETCPITTLSTTNPTRTDLGSNLGLQGKRPTTNCFSQGTLFQSQANIHTFTIICTSGTWSDRDTLPTRDQRTDWTLQLSRLTLVGTKRARLTCSRLFMIVCANSTRYCEQNRYCTVLTCDTAGQNRPDVMKLVGCNEMAETMAGNWDLEIEGLRFETWGLEYPSCPDDVSAIHTSIKVFFSPTDAQLNGLKKKILIYIFKLTLKNSHMFRCSHTIFLEHIIWAC
jgi:hypothetical protein